MKFTKYLIIPFLMSAICSYADAELVERLSDLEMSEYTDQSSLHQLQASAYSGSENKHKSRAYFSEKRSKKKDQESRNVWNPHFEDGNRVQPSSSLFFQSNIGIGLLYFSGVQGNLLQAPNPGTRYVSAPIKQSLSYNRTPLYEAVAGYRFWSYFKAGFSYMHQGNVSVQTKLVSGYTSSPLAAMLFSANVDFNAVMAKLYYEFPWPVFCKGTMTNLYIGSAIGPGWQSWTNIEMLRMFGDNYTSNVQPVRPKTRAHAVWMLDLGFRLQKALPTAQFSMVLGCKFNLWGGSGELGKLEEQGSVKLGLQEPFKIKHIYQWSPYLGVQWNFPDFYYLPKKARLNDDLVPLLVQFNAGPGFLYFKKVRGNLLGNPQKNEPLNLNFFTFWGDTPVNQKITYNRTPLFEYLVQHRFNRCFQAGLSYQYQGGVTIQTSPKTNPNTAVTDDYTQLTASLNLNAIMAKMYFSYPDMVFRKYINVVPYVAFGFGPSWQSWSRVVVSRTFAVSEGLNGGYQPVHQKISANCAINLDTGLRLASSNPNYRFSITAGCKYNLWGQARNIGDLKQQGSYKLGLHRPFSIKKVYQWSPYLGVQWTFSNNFYSQKTYYLEGRKPNTWRPYFIDINSIQKKNSAFTQFNVGIGFLYFSGVGGNLAENPPVRFSQLSRDVPVRSRLTYNRTPLFEYLVGYRIKPWLKGALSYQHQGNITMQTQVLPTYAYNQILPILGPVFDGERNQLTADLVLDAVMAKVYFESPNPLVWKNLVYSPYFGLAGGPAWQTWKRVQINEPFIVLGSFDSFTIPIRPKTSASMAFMFDLGFRMQSPYPETGFSTTLGLKFNVWGQARSLGKISQSYNPRFGLVKPFTIKTIYQWAPYLGVQWNF